MTTWVTGREREFEVYLYDRQAHLRAAATRYHREVDPSAREDTDTAAIVHTFTRYRIAADGSEIVSSLMGMIRLSRERISPLVVAHECAHLAAALYALDVLAPGDLAADHLATDNERFAEVFGEVFDAVWPLVADAVADATVRV